jgi:(p)ppGpp synthase/HD superfamily hydrolase
MMFLSLKWHDRTPRKEQIYGHYVPYSVHLWGLMRAAHRVGAATELILCAIVGHDLLEDTDIPLEELTHVAGEEVTKTIIELTFDPSQKTKELYLESFGKASIPALVIKVLDRIDNVNDFLETDPEYASVYFSKATPVWDALITRKKEIEAYFGTSSVYEKILEKYHELASFFLSYDLHNNRTQP